MSARLCKVAAAASPARRQVVTRGRARGGGAGETWRLRARQPRYAYGRGGGNKTLRGWGCRRAVCSRTGGAFKMRRWCGVFSCGRNVVGVARRRASARGTRQVPACAAERNEGVQLIRSAGMLGVCPYNAVVVVEEKSSPRSTQRRVLPVVPVQCLCGANWWGCVVCVGGRIWVGVAGGR